MSSDLRAPDEADVAALLELNNDHAVELSELTPDGLRELIGIAWRVRIVDDAQAMVVAFDQDTASTGQNFTWFRQRHDRFAYIDRVVVAPHARGRGLARLLYDDVMTAARAAAQPVLCAEVNLDPPNPASDAFHASLGFVEVGRGTILELGKTVRYYERSLAG